MSVVAKRLIEETRIQRPDLYQAILHKIRPHGLNPVLRLFESHLHHVDLDIFNQNREAIPEFVWQVIRRFRFPVPGDPFGIQLTCRITKSDTQGTLDSKHLQSSLDGKVTGFNVHKSILNELNLFTSQMQVFELANRHEYATVFLKRITPVDPLLKTIPEMGHLERGGPLNMGKNAQGQYKYLSTFRFLVVDGGSHLKILYQSTRDLNLLLRYLRVDQVVAFSDVRYLFQKCGIVCYFFNMVEVVRHQLWQNDGSVYEKDMTTLMKYQCRSGTPLPLTRDGLAKNPDRSPIEVLSFEAPKKNYARLSTCSTRGEWCPVETSSDKIFFGQQFNEGTGYSFTLMPKKQS